MVNQSLTKPQTFMVNALVLPTSRNTARLRAKAFTALRMKCHRPVAFEKK